MRKFNVSQIELIKFGLNYLNRLIKEEQNAYKDSKVAVSCISCLWETIKSCEENLKYFVTNQGVYILLDTIEVLFKIIFKKKIISLNNYKKVNL